MELHHHAQPTRDLTRDGPLAPLLRDAQARVAIFDAGCGTGATAWAAATAAAALSDAGYQVPEIDVFGRDTSPFMLDAARSLWSRLTEYLDVSVRVHYSLGSWTETPAEIQAHEEVLVVCSFLLNSSDKQYLKELSRRLHVVHHSMGAHKLLFVSPRSKAHLAKALSSRSQWTASSLHPLDNLWHGDISKLASLRNSLLTSIGQSSPNAPSWSIAAPPEFLLLERHAGSLTDAPRRSVMHNSELPASASTAPNLDTPIRLLDKKQDKAAEPEERLTYLVGAAGSGKSLVLCERVVRLVERARARDPVSALVTTFNKAMVDQLLRWIEARILQSTEGLTIRKKRRDTDEGDQVLTVSNSLQAESKILFLNRDRLPTRVWQEPDSSVEILQSARERSHQAQSSDSKSGGLHLDEGFLARELELIVFGMERLDEIEYIDPQRTPRRGRKTPLTGTQRASLWPHLVQQLSATSAPFPFLRRRIAALRRYQVALGTQAPLELRESVGSFTHVFVDEAQDMTRADLRLLARTPLKPQRFFAAGDTTQALHTAGLSPRPEIEGASWQIRELAGSYRLPALVCEALQPLADEILQNQFEASGAVPEVRRSAVPGPRPIIVDAACSERMANALETMSKFEPQHESGRSAWSVVCEPPSKQHPLRNALMQRGLRVHCESMLRIKGLELPLVIFPTDATPPFDEATEEWVYTALTRSTCVLVIAVCEETSPDIADTLRHIDRRREQLMFWDESAVAAWDAMLNGANS